MGRTANISQHTPEEKAFWEKFCTFAGCEFSTQSGLQFTFTVRGNEVFFSRRVKSITRATIVHAYRLAKELAAKQPVLRSPKQVEVFGSSYLCPIFIKMGIFQGMEPLHHKTRAPKKTKPINTK